ncbi:hypothetical protein AM493_19685 [Flavobacterium akiainvivens]|uniref:Uncharacterized protein n=1 Tax=Flavobacterium akiainvivens TaxID=1202724 RepID=A0A0M8MDN1_9FLAO|nr:hypothetical protein [Flavobacterium akiainvivens]KOS08025.1 hypothetical protein AM493_19685 [Flavobacterium akiainvivens]SFQ62107.1 hypothetical protein SAMN05444144_11083 [Flavobacterium akiainvivens]
MKINLKSGIGQLLFGMKEKDVVALLGEPTRRFKDDEKNTVYQYNDTKLRLTFYADEDFKLGYIIGGAQNLELLGSTAIGQPWDAVYKTLSGAGIKDFEKEASDITEAYFNEANWLLVQVEFGEVTRIEVGAIINQKDEFEWKFK